MIVKPLPKANRYELVEPLTFWVNKKREQVPAGFVFDGASIPRLFWRVLTSPYQPRILRAACIHDYLYRTNLVSRKVADLKFRQVLINDGTDKESAETMYVGLRLGGKSAYRSGPKKPLIGV